MRLMQHQLDAIKNLDNGKILWGGVGTGKSATVLGYYMERELPRDLYVITTAKKRDSLEWEGEAAKFGIGTSKDASVQGVIHIDSWNNIQNYVDVEDAFFVFDEQRLVGNGAWVKSFQKIAKRNHWVMLSATPGDTWLDYIPVFIANGLYKNITQFKYEHIVYAPFTRYPKIVRYENVELLEKYRNMLLVEMPYLMHTTRHVEEIPVDYDKELYKKVVVQRWHVYENRPIRDVAELFSVMRKVVNSDKSRLGKVRELMQSHPRLIVFYNFDYELAILRTLATSGTQYRVGSKEHVPVAEWNGHKHEAIPNTDRWVYLVQYVAGAEGWNCTATDAMVFYSLTYSYKNFMQAQGRIDRLDTPFTDLWYYVLMSNSDICRAVRKSQGQKKLFNERTYALEVLGISADWIQNSGVEGGP